MSKKYIALGVGLVILAGLLKKVLPERHLYEEPNYLVLKEYPGFEIRKYEARLEAKTAVTGEAKQAVNQGFRTLAGYIFGGNVEREKVAMTTPVLYAPDEESTVSFVMPSKHLLSTLPKPSDDRVEFVEVPSQIVAARRFSGWSADTRWLEQREALLRDLAAADLTPDGKPVLAQYDPPWTIGPLRRNEVLVRIHDTPRNP